MCYQPHADLHLFIYSIIHSFIHSFLEGKGRRKRGRGNINVWLPLTCPLLGPGTWDLAHNPGTCPRLGIEPADPLVARLALSPLSYASQGYKYIFFRELSLQTFGSFNLDSLLLGYKHSLYILRVGLLSMTNKSTSQ